MNGRVGKFLFQLFSHHNSYFFMIFLPADLCCPSLLPCTYLSPTSDNPLINDPIAVCYQSRSQPPVCSHFNLV